MYCIVLYCIVLYCIVLYCVVLCCVVLCCVVFIFLLPSAQFFSAITIIIFSSYFAFSLLYLPHLSSSPGSYPTLIHSLLFSSHLFSYLLSSQLKFCRPRLPRGHKIGWPGVFFGFGAMFIGLCGVVIVSNLSDCLSLPLSLFLSLS